MKQNYNAEIASVPMIVKDIDEMLPALKTEKKTRIKTLLAAEESAARLIEHSVPGSQLRLSVRRVLDDVTIVMRTPGERIDFVYDAQKLEIDQETVGPEAESLIRNIVLKSFTKDIRYQNKAGWNIVTLNTARRPGHSSTRRWSPWPQPSWWAC